MNQEKKEKELEIEIWKEEAKKLIDKCSLVRLVKNGEEFYFESYNLDENLDKFIKLRKNGWEIAEIIDLPAYLPSRRTIIEKMNLVEHDWGYRKKSKNK
jgi:hypothetical protein